MPHTETYRIRNYETDRRGQLSLLALANYFQDAADRSAIALGVGMPALAELGLSWVLHRMKINITRWPDIAEEITVKTNPAGLEKIFVYRDFRVYDQANKLLMTATSTWLVFDTEARKLTTPAPHLQVIFDPYRAWEFLPRATARFDALPAEIPSRAEVKARHNEIDINEHVNNAVYFQWMLEALPAAFLDKHFCTEVDIQFKKECGWQDIISSHCAESDALSFRHSLRNDEQKEVAVATTRWLSVTEG